MNRAWFLGILLLACGAGDDNGRHPAVPGEGGSSSAGSKARAGSSSQGDAGAAADGQGGGNAGGAEAVGGTAGDGGIIYEMAGAPRQGEPGVCDPAMMLGDDEAQSVGASGSQLLAMTPDELSVVYLTTGTLYIADRTAQNAAFSEHAVTLSSDYQAASGVALSSDGLRLTVVRANNSGFADLTRAARNEAFEQEPDEARFVNVNDLKETTGRSVAWPVISSDGATLYYLSYFGQGLVVQSSLVGGAFDYGQEIDPFTLGGDAGEYKLLSGISADQRAIFFFDEASGHATALFRSRDGAPFYDPLDLGEREGAVPNQSCSRLYSSIPGGIVAQSTQ